MAILVAAGGAALGSAIGIGASAGWLIGAAAGSLLFPTKGPNITQEGPRLGDLTVTGSAYGSSIAVGYGTVRMAGQMIWSSGIREQKNVSTTRTGGKGGGGGSQTSVTYSYFASFALGFAEGVAEDVLRLWADGKLIFDKTGTGDRTKKDGLNFRFYPGDEQQLPDPLMESDVGAANTPAHRGLCYLVFEDLALADFGNRIPNITAEITFKKTNLQPYQLLDFITTGEGAPLDSYQIDELSIDRDRAIGYFVDSSSNPSLAGIRRFNLQTMKEDRQVLMSDVTSIEPNHFPSTLFAGRDGHIYLITGSSNSRPILRIDPNSMREVGRFGFLSTGLSNSTSRFVAGSWFAMISAYGATGREDFLLTGSLFDDVGLLRAKDMTYVWGSGQSVADARVRGLVSGIVAEGYGDGWILSSHTSTNHTGLALYRLRVQTGARYESLMGQSIGVTFEEMVRFSSSDIEAGATGFYGTAGGLTYDASDDSVIFQCRMSNSGSGGNIYTIKWREGLDIVWKTIVPHQINYDGPGFNGSYVSNSRWALMRSSRVIELDTRTGEIILDETWPTEIRESGAQYFDGANETILVRSVSGWAKLYLGRGGGDGDPLASIVEDLCLKAGFGLADIETTVLSGDVPGYVLGRQTTIRGALEPLASTFFFDVVESDNLLKFIPRGNASALTVSGDELGAVEDEPALRLSETRIQAIELPGRVSVLYMDKARDYVQGTAAAKRIQNPVATTSSDNQVSLDLPMVLEADSAKQVAEKTLYANWVERSRYEAAFDQKYLGLDPADVITIELENGSRFPSRIERLDIGGDYSMKLKLIASEPATYVSGAVADSGQIIAQQIASNRFTELILLNIPLLQDTDDLGGTGSRLYYLMGSPLENPWTGGSLYKSADELTWDQVGRSLYEMAYGVLAAPLDVPTSAFATDEVNSLKVYMTSGAGRLESITQLEMLSGANGAVIIPESGNAEIIQFRDVALQGDGSYLLTGLLRGRRGTDAEIVTHAVGSKFVLLDRESIQALSLALGEVGVSRSWRAVGFGALFDETELRRFSATGNDLKPYAPVHVTGIRDGSGNLTISWQRRTRLGGDWRDGTGVVPLGEASESYQVDILSADGLSVLRTLDGLTSETASYSVSDQITDFGSAQASLQIRVYQLSEKIGRGFPAKAEV